MKLILEVNKEKDLKMLLLLLERLDISYNTIEEAVPKANEGTGESINNDVSHQKNYDIVAIQQMLKDIKKTDVFKTIENPSKWQKQLRDEWE